MGTGVHGIPSAFSGMGRHVPGGAALGQQVRERKGECVRACRQVHLHSTVESTVIGHDLFLVCTGSLGKPEAGRAYVALAGDGASCNCFAIYSELPYVGRIYTWSWSK
eukprot:jgi/Mesen1/6798/ME000035S06178